MFENITNELVDSGFISQDDKEIYTFGLKQGASFLLNILTITVIGLILGMLLQSIIYILAYVPLRVYAGGYHARTPIRCFLLGIPFVVVVLLLERFFVQSNSPAILLGIISSIAIFVLAPVQDANKPLEQIELKVYKHKARFILILENFVMILFLVIGNRDIAIYITTTHIFLCIMLIIGIILQKGKKFRVQKSL